MKHDQRQILSYVLWIGGAPDSGKSTIARNLAERHGLQVYQYDRRDLAHHELLANVDPAYQTFLKASLDERWVIPEPEELFQRWLQAAHDRFPLMIADLIDMSKEGGIIAEGFGLLPELVVPLLSYPNQALWLIPTEDFKQESMIRRGKPSFTAQVSDPKRAKANLLARDLMLAKYYQDQTPNWKCILMEVDGSCSVDRTTDLIEIHFERFLKRLVANTSRSFDTSQK